jgi:Matrixin
MTRRRNKILSALTAIFCICISLPAYAYFYTGYHWSDEDLPVSYWINQIDIPPHISQDGHTNAIVSAFATWNAVKSSYMVFDYVDTTSLEKDLYDGNNVIWWNQDGTGMQTWDLAITWGRPKSGSKELAEIDTEFNGMHDWSVADDQADTERDLQTVMLHEAGHWLWLNHENGDPSVMSESYLGIRRELFADDVFGISHIYYVARITSIEPDSATNSITITWPSHPDRTYRVMWSDNSDSGWQYTTGPLSQQTGTGSDQIFVDDGTTTFGDPAQAPLVPGIQRRFYRIDAMITP